MSYYGNEGLRKLNSSTPGWTWATVIDNSDELEWNGVGPPQTSLGGVVRVHIPEQGPVSVFVEVALLEASGGATVLSRRDTVPTADDALFLLRPRVVWAVALACEAPENDAEILSDVLGKIRLGEERRALALKEDRTPEEEDRLHVLDEELVRRWNIFETEDDREARALIRNIAAHLREVEDGG